MQPRTPHLHASAGIVYVSWAPAVNKARGTDPASATLGCLRQANITSRPAVLPRPYPLPLPLAAAAGSHLQRRRRRISRSASVLRDVHRRRHRLSLASISWQPSPLPPLFFPIYRHSISCCTPSRSSMSLSSRFVLQVLGSFLQPDEIYHITILQVLQVPHLLSLEC
jgi:hypothetical protein